MKMKKIQTFNKIINDLNIFWNKNGCTIIQPTDHEVGAATFHPITFFYALNKKKCKFSYTQISKRPSDIINNPCSNKSIIFHQYQVIIKPSDENIKDLYMNSIKSLGIYDYENEIRFVEDNWKSPTLGASGIGWEVRLNGTEITQFTYFQKMGDLNCYPIMVELAYGIERLALYKQNLDNFKNIIIDQVEDRIIKFSDIRFNYEKELSFYIMNYTDTKRLFYDFNYFENECSSLIEKNLIYIAYERVIKLSHLFNIIDSKMLLSNIERQNFIFKIRNLSNKIAIKAQSAK
jgi:glycyl-tRNA synthetase alpha chain